MLFIAWDEMVLRRTWATFQVPPFSIPGSHSFKEQKVQDDSSGSSRVGGIKLFQRVASRRWDAKTHADSSFGQVPKHTANQSSRHLSVKSGGRQSGAAPKSRDGGVMMAPQQAVSVWLICIGVAYVWGHGGEALDELSVVWSLKDGMKPWEISDQDNQDSFQFLINSVWSNYSCFYAFSNFQLMSFDISAFMGS